MAYRWIGRKPHHRSVSIFEGSGRQRRVVGVELNDVQPGDLFEPTPAELRSFPDLIEMVGGHADAEEKALAPQER